MAKNEKKVEKIKTVLLESSLFNTRVIKDLEEMKNNIFIYNEKDWYIDVSIYIDWKLFWKKLKNKQFHIEWAWPIEWLYILYKWFQSTLRLYKNPKLIGVWQYQTEWLIW